MLFIAIVALGYAYLETLATPRTRKVWVSPAVPLANNPSLVSYTKLHSAWDGRSGAADSGAEMTVDEHITRLSTLDGEFTQLEEFVRINDGFYRFRGMHVNITVMKERLVIKDESQRQTGWNRGAWGDIGRFLRDMEAQTPQAPPPSWVEG